MKDLKIMKCVGGNIDSLSFMIHCTEAEMYTR